LRLSFSQIARVFEAYRLKEENEWRRVRLVAYETWRHGAKNAPGIETYFPIGREDKKPELSKDDLDEVWQKYGKLKRKKRVRISRLLKNVTART